MKVGELSPPVVDRIQFSLRYQKHVPIESGCYVLTTFAGDVLYVGLTNKLRRRFGQHRDSENKRKVTNLGKAFWFYYILKAEKEIRRVERAWQNQYCSVHGALPILNLVASPIA